MVEVLKVLAHFVEHILNRDIDLLHYSFIDVSYYLLNNFELLEKFAASFQDILGENVLLSIDPKVWESFLGGIKNLGKVT